MRRLTFIEFINSVSPPPLTHTQTHTQCLLKCYYFLHYLNVIFSIIHFIYLDFLNKINF